MPHPRKRETPGRRSDGIGLANVGADYSADELEFLRAVAAEQKRTGRKFLAHTDYLRVARSLGYVRPPKEPT